MLQGDPRVTELFTFRAKIPAGWKAFPHFHPIDEQMTVLEGCCYLGVGDTFDETTAAHLHTHAFTAVKAGTVHYFFTKESCTIQVHGVGPHRITYVNPADDPRNALEAN
jgi:hypothetical protein